MVESAFVRGAHDNAGSLAGLKRFLPTRSTQAPTVAGFQAAKAEFRHRCRKIVATRPLRIDEAPVVETHLVKGGRPKARNEAAQKQINSARERAPADRVEKLPRVPLAAATADRLGSTVVLGNTVVAAAVSTSGHSPVAPVSDGLRLIDTQLHTARRHLR